MELWGAILSLKHPWAHHPDFPTLNPVPHICLRLLASGPSWRVPDEAGVGP